MTDWELAVEKIEKFNKGLMKVEWKLLSGIKSLATSLITYGILLYVMIYVWDYWGWERVVLILGCGVILYGLKANHDAEFKQIEINHLKREIEVLKEALRNGKI